MELWEYVPLVHLVCGTLLWQPELRQSDALLPATSPSTTSQPSSWKVAVFKQTVLRPTSSTITTDSSIPSSLTSFLFVRPKRSPWGLQSPLYCYGRWMFLGLSATPDCSFFPWYLQSHKATIPGLSSFVWLLASIAFAGLFFPIALEPLLVSLQTLLQSTHLQYHLCTNDSNFHLKLGPSL